MIIPHQFVAGTKAKAQEVNENFIAVSEELAALAENMTNGNATVMANINTKISNVEEQLAALKNLAYPIGSPKAVLNNSLNDDEIWLEGQEVSKNTYDKLYEVYGDTYGTPRSTNNFVLPDFRNRVMWGATEFGYISAGLPAVKVYITGSSADLGDAGSLYITNAGQDNGTRTLTTSSSDAIYGKSSTVQPPAVKVRVKTRYK